jgi:hypothetical protein
LFTRLWLLGHSGWTFAAGAPPRYHRMLDIEAGRDFGAPFYNRVGRTDDHIAAISGVVRPIIPPA